MPTVADDVLPVPTQVINNGADASRWDTYFGRFLNLAGVTGSTTPGIQVLSRINTSPGGLRFYRGRDTAGANTIVASGDLIGYIDALGYDGAAYQTAARIQLVVDTTPGAGDMPGRIEFHTTPDGASALSERWRIDNAGTFRPASDGAGAAAGLAELGTAAARLRRVNVGNLWVPYAFACGAKAIDTTQLNLAIVAAGIGDAIAVPFFLEGPMLLQSIAFIQGSTASLRTAEYRLYADNRTPGSAGAMDFVAGTDGTLSFTPAAVDIRVGTISAAPVYLAPGTYWLVLRNTSTAQTFQIRVAAAGGTWATSTALAMYKFTNGTKVAALGSTIDVTSWADFVDHPAIRLQGRVMGETVAF